MQHATLTDSKAQQLRVLAVQLNWRSTQLRPDMSYQACEVSTKVKYAKIIDTKNANKAIRKLKSSEKHQSCITLTIWKNHTLSAFVMQH